MRSDIPVPCEPPPSICTKKGLSLNFKIYAFGQVVSLCGNWMQNVALGWLVFSLTGQASALGWIAFATNLPVLLFTFLGGTIADNYNRRNVLTVASFCCLVQALLLAGMIIFQIANLERLLILSLLLGLVTALEVPTRHAFLGDLVEEGELTRAICFNSAIVNTARMIGPALAGLVIVYWGETVCFLLNAASYLVAIITLLCLRVKTHHHLHHQNDLERGELDLVCPEKDLAAKQPLEKLSAALRHRSIRGALALTAGIAIFGLQYPVLLPVLVSHLKGGAGMLGWLSALGGVGALLGALSLSNCKSAKVISWSIGLACLGMGGAIAGMAYSHNLILTAVAITVAGMFSSLLLTGAKALIQTTVSARMRGKLMGLYAMFLLGLSPFAAISAGYAAQTWGVSFALQISAAGTLVWGFCYLVGRLFDKHS